MKSICYKKVSIVILSYICLTTLTATEKAPQWEKDSNQKANPFKHLRRRRNRVKKNQGGNTGGTATSTQESTQTTTTQVQAVKQQSDTTPLANKTRPKIVFLSLAALQAQLKNDQEFNATIKYPGAHLQQADAEKKNSRANYCHHELCAHMLPCPDHTT